MLRTALLAATAASALAVTPVMADETDETIVKQWSDGIPPVYQIALQSGIQRCSFEITDPNDGLFDLVQWQNGWINVSLHRKAHPWTAGVSVTLTVDGDVPFTAQGAIVSDSNPFGGNWLNVAIPNEGAGRAFLHDLWNGQNVHVVAGQMVTDFSLASSATAILRLYQCGDAIVTTQTTTTAPAPTPAAPQPFAPTPVIVPPTPSPAPTVTAPAATTTASVGFAQLGVSGGTYTIPVLVNDQRANFTLDSGAALTHMPGSVIGQMIANGSISPTDYRRNVVLVDASGHETNTPVYILHSVTVGGVTIRDVECAVGIDPDTFLLGQSFLAKLPSWSIDNKTGLFVIGG